MKKSRPVLIVMLTYNDLTVENAKEIFEECKNSKAEYFGFKEEPLSFDEMKELFDIMKSCGKNTALEVVAYDEESCLKGAQMAVDCGCDMLMGTVFFDSVNELCKKHGIKYTPFVGTITERPSVLDGTVEEMIDQAERYLEKGVFGFDLLGYRYTGDAYELNKEFVRSVDAPVCIAGSVNSYERLDEVLEVAPWGFTIGSAFFDNKFGGSFSEQIDKVCDYIESREVVTNA